MAGPTTTERERRWLKTAAILLVSLALVTSLFDLTRHYAFDTGDRRVRTLEPEPDIHPEVVIFSTADLGLEHMGAYEELLDAPARVPDDEAADPELAAERGATIYRYSGLRLIEEANSRLLVWSCDRNVRADGATLVPIQPGMWFDAKASRRPEGREDDAFYCETSLDTVSALYDAGDFDDVVGEVDRISEGRPSSAFTDNLAVYRAVARLEMGVDETERAEIAELLDVAGRVWFLAPRTDAALARGKTLLDDEDGEGKIP